MASLRDEPINGWLIVFTMILYCLNRFYLKDHTSGWLNYVLRCHLNDTLCGTLFVAYSNVFFKRSVFALIDMIMIVTVAPDILAVFSFGKYFPT